MQSVCERIAAVGSAISLAHRDMLIHGVVAVAAVTSSCTGCVQFWRGYYHARNIVD